MQAGNDPQPRRLHEYSLTTNWTGNRGTGTSAYAAYGRDHIIGASGKPPIPASSDPAFRGDTLRWNPEELLVAAVSSCHQLWYLHLCAEAGIAVLSYQDDATGQMAEYKDGSGRFIEIVLRPRVTIGAGDEAQAITLHHAAHEFCFVANSINFPVKIEPECRKAG